MCMYMYIHVYIQCRYNVYVFTISHCSGIGWMAAVVSLNEQRAGPRFKRGEGVAGMCSDGEWHTIVCTCIPTSLHLPLYIHCVVCMYTCTCIHTCHRWAVYCFCAHAYILHVRKTIRTVHLVITHTDNTQELVHVTSPLCMELVTLLLYMFCWRLMTLAFNIMTSSVCISGVVRHSVVNQIHYNCHTFMLRWQS